MTHPKFGDGEVIGRMDGKIEIRFERCQKARGQEQGREQEAVGREAAANRPGRATLGVNDTLGLGSRPSSMGGLHGPKNGSRPKCVISKVRVLGRASRPRSRSATTQFQPTGEDMLINIERFTSTAIDDLRVSFSCSVCSAVARADVIIENAVEVTMPIHVSESLREGARSAAVTGLPEAARQAVGLTGCPSCGAMDPATARWQRIAAAFAALGSWYGIAAAVFAIVVGVIGASASTVGTQLISVAVAAAILALGMGLGGRARFAEKQRWARSRVTWVRAA